MIVSAVINKPVCNTALAEYKVQMNATTRGLW